MDLGSAEAPGSLPPAGDRRIPQPRDPRRVRVFLGRILLPALVLSLWGCFPTPDYDLWPPRKGEPRHTIQVVCRDWHTFLVLPVETGEGDAAAGSRREWEYAEKAWYLDGSQGLGGALRALFWPTESTLGSRPLPADPCGGDGTPDVECWTFVLSEAGWQAVQAYLDSQRDAAIRDFPGWYTGKESYHFFHHCHHFTAEALRAAGLPVSPWWAFNVWLFEIQLDRVRRFHGAEGLQG